MRWPRWLGGRRPEPDPDAELLRVLGAVGVFPPAAETYFVYGLVGHDGKTFYTGKSKNILTRLGAHVKVYGDTIASVWLARMGSEWSMAVTEDFLIDRLKPVMNVHGMSGDPEMSRARLVRRTAKFHGPHLAPVRDTAVEEAAE